MSTASVSSPSTSAAGAPRRDFVAALLSYLIPGLGQIYQGRIGKGLMFAVCLLGMFWYGMYRGDWKNVYLPNRGEVSGIAASGWFPGPVKYALHRFHFAGQFWIGITVWPAILHYYEIELVSPETSRFWHEFQSTPPEHEVNQLQAQSGKGKLWDLAVVYTIIAGVLNILVMYDAFAGPALQGSSEETALKPAPQEAVA